MKLGSKILIIGLIVLTAGNFIFIPKKTEALFGIGDITFDPSNYAVALKDFALKLAEDTYKGLRDQASKRIIDSIVNDTAKWIENGGQPRFVTDWEKFLKDAGNKAVGDVIMETDLAFVCSPFKVQLKFALQPTHIYEESIRCTLDDIKGNIEDFYEDFSKGGWVSYNKMWGSGGNFYIAYLSGVNEISARSSEAKIAAQSEAVAGGGYLGVKQCVLRDEADEDLDGDTNECLKYETVNPGKAVGDIAANAIGADTEWATSIESWTSVLTNALVNRLTKEGVGWLKSTAADIFDGGSGSSPAIGYSAETQALADQKTENENKTMASELQKFVDFDWDYLSDLKEESLDHFKKNYAMASIIEYKKSLNPVIGCNLPFGYEYRPRTLEREAEEAIIEVDNLEKNVSSTIDRAEQLIIEINLAVNPAERLSVQQKYQNFINENDLGGIESYIRSAEQEWQDSGSILETLWKEFDRPECYSPDFYKYAGDGQKYLPDFADKLLEGKTISEILGAPSQ
jgi:hypothetical protein